MLTDQKFLNSRTISVLRLGWVAVLIVVFWRACSPNPLILLDLGNDKLLHVVIFLALGLWAQLVWTDYKLRIVSIGFLAFCGIAIECVQYFVPGRSFSIMDWLMGILGLAIAVLLIKLYPLAEASRRKLMVPKKSAITDEDQSCS